VQTKSFDNISINYLKFWWCQHQHRNK